MADFDINAALDRLAVRLCREIRSDRKRRKVTAEYRGHLEDGAEELLHRGYTPEDAYRELEESLGDTDKISTILASVHNTRHFPRWLPWLAVAAVVGSIYYVYRTTDNPYIRAWLEVGFQLLAIAAVVVLGLIAAKWIRAFHKRATALRRLKKYVRENGGTLTRHKNTYGSLFVRTSAPELSVDIGDRRYILSFWATVKRRRTLHLQDNGIYSYDHHFGYMLYTQGIAPHARVTLFRPKGMENDPLFTFYHSEVFKLPEGAHLMPDMNYGSCFAPGKINIPVFLLNPIPMDVEICENGHIHKLIDGDTLPESLGSARLCSMSGLLSLMEEIRIFGKDGGKKKEFGS